LTAFKLRAFPPTMLIAAEIQRSSTRNRQAWSSAECELMPH
jgi:hypothetical protein